MSDKSNYNQKAMVTQGDKQDFVREKKREKFSKEKFFQL